MRTASTAALLAAVLLATAASAPANAKPRRAPRAATATATAADDEPAENVSRCVKYTQSDPSDAGMLLHLENTCRAPVTCSLSWRLACSSDRKARARASTRLDLQPGHDDSALAEATACGRSAWEIAGVRWSCEHAKAPVSDEPKDTPKDATAKSSKRDDDDRSSREL